LWKKKGPMMQSFIMPQHTLNFGVSLLRSILYFRWLTTPNSAVMCVQGTIQMERYLTRKSHRNRENFITVNFLQHFLTKSLSSVTVTAGLIFCCNCNLFGCKCTRLCTMSWTVERGRCSCLLAVQLNLHELCRNACLMCSLYSLDILEISDL
jgi:hypothetical protein